MTQPAQGSGRSFGWFEIARLGLVQASIGAIVVLATSTLNRVMVVELALPAALPGGLVALHYTVQVLRPRLGHGSDQGGRQTPWIIAGMAILALGGVAAAVGTAWMATNFWLGLVLATTAFVMIGVGVGAAGTALLVLLAKHVARHRRAPAASIVWVMMIAGFAITAGLGGHLLQPFSYLRLVEVSAGAAALALVLSVAAIWGLEGRATPSAPERRDRPMPPATPFLVALMQVWREPKARHFAIFVFVSMLGYSAQELILEPFAGAVFDLTPGESAQLTGVQHGGALVGMLLVALVGGRFGSMRLWTLGGCIGSAAGLAALAFSGLAGPSFPLLPTVFLLGAANGTFAVSAIGSMMGLATDGREAREGVRMGLWGAAQAVAFACGGIVATLGSDAARHFLGSPVAAYALVFSGEAALFLVAARQAAAVYGPASGRRPVGLPQGTVELSRS